MRNAIVLTSLAASAIACSALSTSAPPPPGAATTAGTVFEALTAPAPTVASTTPVTGTPFDSNGISLTIPTGLASGASIELVAAATDENSSPWGSTPAFRQLTLQGYELQNKFFEPQIRVYPAAAYGSTNNGAAISTSRLQAIIANPSAPMTNDVLPRLPFANAEQIIGAAPRLLAFHNGTGVRVLAEYAQYFAPINNQELFYHFEGLTSDGEYYVVTTLPINAGFLAAVSDPAAQVPPAGVPFPGYDSTDPAIFENYYLQVTNLLGATSPDGFQPTLTALDALVESLTIAP